MQERCEELEAEIEHTNAENLRCNDLIDQLNGDFYNLRTENDELRAQVSRMEVQTLAQDGSRSTTMFGDPAAKAHLLARQ